MSAYSQDLESTRRIQTQLASAWQQGRDYWESHPHEKPNATQMGVDDYLVQTGLLSLQLCVAQHATPPRTPEPISPESSLRSPTFSLFSRLDSVKFGSTRSRESSATSTSGGTSPVKSLYTQSMRSTLSLLPAPFGSTSKRSWRCRNVTSRSSHKGGGARISRDTMPPHIPWKPTKQQRRNTVSGA